MVRGEIRTAGLVAPWPPLSTGSPARPVTYLYEAIACASVEGAAAIAVTDVRVATGPQCRAKAAKLLSGSSLQDDDGLLCIKRLCYGLHEIVLVAHVASKFRKLACECVLALLLGSCGYEISWAELAQTVLLPRPT